MEKSDSSIEIGLTVSDIEKLLKGEILLCFHDKEIEVYVKSWTEPNILKIVKNE